MVGSSSGKDQGSLPVEVASPGFGIDGGGGGSLFNVVALEGALVNRPTAEGASRYLKGTFERIVWQVARAGLDEMQVTTCGCLANARRDRRYEWEDFGDDDFEVLVDEIELEAARRILDRHEPRRRIFECLEASQDATAAIKGEFGW